MPIISNFIGVEMKTRATLFAPQILKKTRVLQVTMKKIVLVNRYLKCFLHSDTVAILKNKFWFHPLISFSVSGNSFFLTEVAYQIF